MPRRAQSQRESRFSRRLNRLFAERLAPENPPRPWTLTEVSDKTGLSVNYLSRARLGQIEYPGPDKLKKLAEFFGVHVDYFTQEREDAAEAALVSPAMLQNLRKPGISSLLLRAGNLGPEELKVLANLMEYLESRKRDKDNAERPES